jgi:VWFA-related protein
MSKYQSKKSVLAKLAGGLVVVCLAFAGIVNAQSTAPASAPPQDDVVRVETNLVQTDLMVFDKQGNFVTGLKPEQFEITVDGKPQPISFFEQVTAGTAKEQRQLAAIRQAQQPQNAAAAAPANVRGRTIFFFVDDNHLSPEGLTRSRTSLNRFIDEQMGDEDQVAIVSTSGQIGFLQQLTDNPTVLRTAASRLNYKRETEAFAGRTQITEAIASQIADYHNKALFAYLLDSVKAEQQMGPGNRQGDHRVAAAYAALPMLENRISQVNTDSKLQASYTLQALESLIGASAGIPGRKLVIFLSDGFPFDARNTQNHALLKRVTSAAARSGAVFYSFDMRGNFLTAGVDASSTAMADVSSRLAGVGASMEMSTREVMNILADDTGGRMIANSNRISDDIGKAVRESGDYYLLAWTLAPEQMAASRVRVKISVKDRSDLKVRMRSDNVITAARPGSPEEQVNGKPAKGKPAAPPDPQVELLAALGSNYSHRQIPLLLSTGYVAGTDGLTLKLSMQIDRNSLTANPAATAPEPARLDVIGAAVDDRVVIVSFKQTVSLNPSSTGPVDPVIWNQQLKVPAGLYQVRVAVRESTTGRTGTAQQWIEVPGPADGKLAVSSIFLAERAPEVVREGAAGPSPVIVDVDHKFDHGSVLRFQTYVYNAAQSPSNPPDVWLEAKVLHNGQPVMAVSPNQLPVTGSATLPYWAEIGLNQLQAGRYVLLVNATDRRAGSTAVQRIKFTVE